MAYATDFRKSEVRFAADSQNLYVELAAQEDQTGSLQTGYSPDDKTSSVFSDDCFEVMFAHPEKDSPYLQIGVNAKGHFQVLEQTRLGSNEIKVPNLKSSALMAPSGKGWAVTLEIPLREIRKYCPDGKGRIAVFRYRPGTGGRESQSSGISVEGGNSNHVLKYYKKVEIPSENRGVFDRIF